MFLPTRKCPGVNTKSSSSSVASSVQMGLLFMMALTSANSSCLSRCGEMIFLSRCFMALMPASQIPPIWGVLACTKCHLMPCWLAVLMICSFDFSKSCCILCSSFAAPKKFAPLSANTSEGVPLMLHNFLNFSMNTLVSIVLHVSM